MKKIFNKLVFSFFALLIFTKPISDIEASALLLEAGPNRNFNSYDFQKSAYVNYQNGVESLILTLEKTNPNSDLVWIIPIPAKSNEIKTFNNLKYKPAIYDGIKLEDKTKPMIITQMVILSISEFIPTLTLPTLIGLLPETFEDFIIEQIWLITKDFLGSDFQALPITNFSIEEIDNSGITTEVIEATSEDDLKQYLLENNIIIDNNKLKPLRDYYQKGFSFVITKINKDEPSLDFSNKQINRAIMIKFPNDKIFFPITKTSDGFSDKSSELINVIGLKNLNGNIKEGEITTFKKLFVTINPEAFTKDFSNEVNLFKISDYAYFTLIGFKMDRDSNEDIYLDPVYSVGGELSKFLIENTAFSIFFIWIFFSIISSVIASFICFKEARSKKIVKFAFLGLANLLSFWGLAFVTALLKTKKVQGNDNKYIRADKRKIFYLILFLIFNLLFVNITGIITLWLLKL